MGSSVLPQTTQAGAELEKLAQKYAPAVTPAGDQLEALARQYAPADFEQPVGRAGGMPRLTPLNPFQRDIAERAAPPTQLHPSEVAQPLVQADVSRVGPPPGSEGTKANPFLDLALNWADLPRKVVAGAQGMGHAAFMTGAGVGQDISRLVQPEVQAAWEREHGAISPQEIGQAFTETATNMFAPGMSEAVFTNPNVIRGIGSGTAAMAQHGATGAAMGAASSPDNRLQGGMLGALMGAGGAKLLGARNTIRQEVQPPAIDPNGPEWSNQDVYEGRRTDIHRERDASRMIGGRTEWAQEHTPRPATATVKVAEPTPEPTPSPFKAWMDRVMGRGKPEELPTDEAARRAVTGDYTVEENAENRARVVELAKERLDRAREAVRVRDEALAKMREPPTVQRGEVAQPETGPDYTAELGEHKTQASLDLANMAEQYASGGQRQLPAPEEPTNTPLRDAKGKLRRDLSAVSEDELHAEYRRMAELNATEEGLHRSVDDAAYRRDYEELPRTEKYGKKGQEDLPDADSMVDPERLLADNKMEAEYNRNIVVRRARAAGMKRIDAELERRQAEAERQAEREGEMGLTGEEEDFSFQRPQKTSRAQPYDIAEMKTGEGKVGAGFDKSLFKKLGANMYKGNLGVIAVKEGLQNAADSIRGTEGGGEVHINYEGPNHGETEWNPDTQKYDALPDHGGRLTMHDTGRGMSPEVMETAFVDVGGSFKDAADASGGYGLAKVALFSKSASIYARSVYRTPEGKKIATQISGSGTDWAEGNLSFHSEEVPADTRTGTQLSLEFERGSSAHAGDVSRWLKNAVAHTRLPLEFKGQSGGRGLDTEREPMMPDPVADWTVPGARMKLYESKARRDADTRLSPWQKNTVNIHVLNRGLYQFSTDQYVEGRGLPSHLTLDVIPTVDVEDANYPFTTSREELKKAAADKVEEFVRNLKQVAGKKETSGLSEALDKGGVQTPGGQYRVFDDTGAMSPELVEKIAGSKWVSPLLSAVHSLTRTAYMGLTEEGHGRRIQGYRFGGMGLSKKWLGVNISTGKLSGLIGEHDREAARKMLEQPNMLLWNPFTSHMEVADRNDYRQQYDGSPYDVKKWAHHMAAKAWGTQVHELAHQLARGHDADFAGVLTRFIEDLVNIAPGAIDALIPHFIRAADAGFFDHYRDINDEWERINAKQKDTGLFDKIADERRAQRNRGGVVIDRDAGTTGLGRAPVSGTGIVSAARGRRAGGVPGGPPTGGPPGGGGAGAPGPAPAGPPVQPNALKRAGLELLKLNDAIRRLLAADTRGPQSAMAGAILRQNAGVMDRKDAQAREALKSFSKIVDRWPEPTKGDPIDVLMANPRFEFVDEMEHGRQMTAGQGGRTIRDILDNTRDEVIGLGTGALESFYENYMPHAWEDPSGAGSFYQQFMAKRPARGSQAFLRERTMPTYRDGLEAGLWPVSTNPVDMALIKNHEMRKYIMAHRTWQEYKEKGLIKFVRATDRAPQGYAKFNDKIATVFGPITPEGARTIRGEYWGPEQVAHVFNTYYMPGMRGNTVYDWFMYPANGLNVAQLSMSAFHAGLMVFEAAASDIALAGESLSRGDIGKGAGSLARGLTPLGSIGHSLVLGDKILRQYLDPNSTNNALIRVMAAAVADAGGRAFMDQAWDVGAMREFGKAWRMGKYGTVLAKALPAGFEATMAPIMRGIVPRVKLAAFGQLAVSNIEKLGASPSHEDVRFAVQRAWNSIDNRFGQYVYRNKFANAYWKDAGHGLVRALGWTGGTVGEVGGGGLDVIRMARDAAKGERPKMTSRTWYTIALFLSVAWFGALLQLALTGDPPKGLKDLYYPRTGKKNEEGNDERLQLPTYMKDVISWYKHAGTTAIHKLTPILNALAELAQNRNFYGDQIINPDAPLGQKAKQLGKFAVEQASPFTVRNISEEGKRQQGGVVKALNYFGVTPAPRDATRTAAQNAIMDKLSLRGHDVGTPEEAEARQAKGDLRAELRGGTPGAMGELTDKAVAGEFTKRSAKALVKSAHTDPWISRFRQLDLNDALEVYHHASPEEQKAWKIEVLKKIRNARNAGQRVVVPPWLFAQP